MSSVLGRRTAHCERAERLVEAWVQRYTRGLPRPVADDRIAELRSDLWEQREAGRWHHRRDLPVALDIVGRMIRGVPGDLGWRQGHLIGAPPSPVSRLSVAWTGRVSVVLAALIGGATLLLTFYAIIRTMTDGLSSAVPETAKFSLLVAIVVLLAGFALLRHPRRRWLAALWTGAGVALALHADAQTLFVLSATARQYAAAEASPMASVTLGGLVVFFIVLAVSWRLDPTEEAR